MSTISAVETLREAAVEAASALAELGYATDFSPASLADVDRFFDGEHCEAALAGDIAGKIFLIGAYVGEVILSAAGGAWALGDEEPILALPSGVATSPIARVAMRLQSSVVTLADYGVAHGLALRVPSVHVP